MDLPIKFQDKVKAAPSASGTGYPYRISANDLDKNFAYAALDGEDDWIEQSSAGGHNGRKLRLPALPSGGGTQNLSSVGGSIGWTPGLPALPSGGTHVLGCVDGNLEWIETEEC